MITRDIIVKVKSEITKIHRIEFLSKDIVMCFLHKVQNLLIKWHPMMTYKQLYQFLKNKYFLKNSLEAEIYRKFWFIFIRLAKLISMIMVLLIVDISFDDLTNYF